VALSNVDGHIYATPMLSFWEKLGNKLRLLKGLLKNGTRDDLLQDTRESIGEQLGNVSKSMPINLNMDPMKIANKILRSIDALDTTMVEISIQLVNHCLKTAIQANSKESSQRYLQFLQKSLAGSAGVGHSLLKTIERDAGVSYEEVDDIRAETQGPNVKDRMVTRICSWAVGKWKVNHTTYQADLQQAWQDITSACSDPELPKPKVHMQQLRRILKSWPAKAGLGLDQWVLRLWNELPDEGLRVLINLIYLAMDGIVPMQLLLVLIGLLPKEAGGERPIALTSMLYRLIMKLEKPECGQWEQDIAGFWDTAISGSSCLRAALARALGMEAAQARGFATIGILWDLAAFFDSIRIHRLVKLALERRFPPRALRLAMKVHAGARAFKEGPYISNFVQPAGVSILAGCGRSVSFTRAALYDVLESMHRDYTDPAISKLMWTTSLRCIWGLRM
jgi:hypothetical protein